MQAAGQLPAPPAGGLAGGLAGAGVGELLGNATAGVFAGAAAGGAVASTIMGGDPGIGALYAVAAAGLAYSFPSVRAEIAKFQKYLDNKTRQTVSAMAQGKGHVVLTSNKHPYAQAPGNCTGECHGVGVQWGATPPGQGFGGAHHAYDFILDIFCDCEGMGLTGSLFGSGKGGTFSVRGFQGISLPFTGKISTSWGVTNRYFLEIYGAPNLPSIGTFDFLFNNKIFPETFHFPPGVLRHET